MSHAGRVTTKQYASGGRSFFNDFRHDLAIYTAVYRGRLKTRTVCKNKSPPARSLQSVSRSIKTDTTAATPCCAASARRDGPQVMYNVFDPAFISLVRAHMQRYNWFKAKFFAIPLPSHFGILKIFKNCLPTDWFVFRSFKYLACYPYQFYCYTCVHFIGKVEKIWSRKYANTTGYEI